MIAELKRLADAAQPTPFHHMLKMIDEQGRLMRVYTQNIDALEQKAGLTFGLGEVGDSSATMRALGKRKRNEANATNARLPSSMPDTLGGRRSFARCQSDSALLWARKQADEEGKPLPMFPRTIPLHGSLHSLSCSICTHKMNLDPDCIDNTPPPDASATVRTPEEALLLLEKGEPIPCPRCEVADEVRTCNGLRSRGVGRMKVEVVLYGGQNDGAERVGECLSRDILGLRDPNEPAVPESVRETQARERREQKTLGKRPSRSDMAQSSRESSEKSDDGTRSPFPKRKFVASRSEAAPYRRVTSVQVTSPIDLTHDDDETGLFREEPIDLSIIQDSDRSADEVFQAHFDNPDHTGLASVVNTIAPQPTNQKKAPKKQKMKPLPPDLLIVAGTSLKVPGTKRIVREFAKACKARDRRVYPSDEEESEEEVSGRSSVRNCRKKPSPAEEEEEEDNEEEEDPKAPIRTVLINYDFPIPAKEWEGVFDVWLQGDLQNAARGLAPTSQSSKDCGLTLSKEFQVSDRFRGEHAPTEDDSWIAYKQALDEMRLAEKRGGNAKRLSGVPPQLTLKTASKGKPAESEATSAASPVRPSSSSKKSGSPSKPKQQTTQATSIKRAAGSMKITGMLPATVASSKKAVAFNAKGGRSKK